MSGAPQQYPYSPHSRLPQSRRASCLHSSGILARTGSTPPTSSLAPLLGLLSAPRSVFCCLGYLHSVGEASKPLRGTLIGSAARVGLTLALVPRLGATAIGIGYATATFAEMPILLRETRRRTGARIGQRIRVPATSASLAGGLGWLVCDWTGRSVLGGCFAVVITISLSSALIFLGDRSGFRDAVQMSRRAAGLASRRRRLSMEPGSPLRVPVESNFEG